MADRLVAAFQYKLQNNEKIIIIMTTMDYFVAFSPMEWKMDTGYTAIG